MTFVDFRLRGPLVWTVSSLLGLVTFSAAASELKWGSQLYGNSREQIEVLVDTTQIPANAVLEDALFEATFFDRGGIKLGTQRFLITDDQLPALTAGHVYRRRFFLAHTGASRVATSELRFEERAAGGKADGDSKSVGAAASTSIQSNPDVTIDARHAPQQVIAKVVVPDRAKSTAALNPVVRRCRAYSDIAVAQNDANLGNRCGLVGAMWNSKYGYHFDWCLSAPAPNTRAGTADRQRMLNDCAP